MKKASEEKTYLEKFKKIFHSPAARYVWHWSKSVRLPLMIISLISMLVSVGSLLVTTTTKDLINGATGGDLNQVVFNGVLLFALVLAMRGLSLLNSYIKNKNSLKYLMKLRTMIMDSLLKKKFAGLSGYHSGELVNRLFSDITVVRNGILNIVPSVMSMLVSFIGAFIILLSMDWRFIILMVAGGVFALTLMMLFREPMKRRHKRVQEAEGLVHSFMQETLVNMRIIKASGSEKRVKKRSDFLSGNLYGFQLKNAYFSMWMNTGINMMFQLSWAFCMIWGAVSIFKGTLSYGSLAAIIQLVNMIQSPIANSADIASQLYSTFSSAERLKELIDLPEEEMSLEDVADAAQIESVDSLYGRLKQIKIENVGFSYEPFMDKNRQMVADACEALNEKAQMPIVLKDVCAEIKPGDFVALTGISGGGKSTLFQLLLGVYQPTQGSIDFEFEAGPEDGLACDGASGANAENAAIYKMPAGVKTRRLFGYVPQGNTLFSGTLRENFLMFTDSATDGEIMEAARIACIDEFVQELDEGLDTEIGERGLGLSEGQAQRIGIARMLLSKAPILLLDESTSALDEETEARLLANINKLRSKTCFIVTHRPAALKICNMRLHLEQGQMTKIDSRDVSL